MSSSEALCLFDFQGDFKQARSKSGLLPSVVIPWFGEADKEKPQCLLAKPFAFLISKVTSSKLGHLGNQKGLYRVSDTGLFFAEREGFEPSVRSPAHTLSKRAP